MLLWQADASLVGRHLSQSVGKLDHGHSAWHSTRAHPAIRICRRTREFLLPDVAIEAQEIRWPNLRSFSVYLRSGPFLPGILARRSRPRHRLRWRHVGNPTDRDRIGSRRRFHLVAPPGPQTSRFATRK